MFQAAFNWKVFGYVVLVILLVVIIALGVLYYFGSKLQKKQEAQKAQMDAMAQTVSMLIIDKKILPLKDSGLPQIAIDQTPKYMRRSKVPVVKAKIGNRIMNLIADNAVFDILPVKKECKVVLSGIYITEIKSVRGGSIPQRPAKKKNFFQRTADKLKKKQAETKDAQKK
ncbi:MAG: hypothetical protein ACI4C1_01980 [Lachnospiraceae bacterium]